MSKFGSNQGLNSNIRTMTWNYVKRETRQCRNPLTWGRGSYVFDKTSTAELRMVIIKLKTNLKHWHVGYTSPVKTFV